MSTQQQMNKPQSPTSVKATPPNNKRKAPSQARLDKLKKLKENNETWKSHDLTSRCLTLYSPYSTISCIPGVRKNSSTCS